MSQFEKIMFKLFAGIKHLVAPAFLLVSGLSGAGHASGEERLSSEQKLKFSTAIETLYKDQSLVGVQGAVFVKGVAAFNVNFGYADLEHEVPVVDGTRFEVASITKAFTGLALLNLAEQGDIDLDAPIQKTVPEFPIKPEGKITPRMLAGATSGIRHYQDGEKTTKFHNRHFTDVADSLVLFKDDALIAVPGAKTSYSSYGYNLLAAAIQRASGKQFQRYIRETLIEPLALTNTGFVDVTKPLSRRTRHYSYIHPYTRESLEELMIVPTMEHSYNMGGGNMYSSAKDLAKFGGQFLKPGFVSASVLQQIFEPHKTNTGSPTYFSDGWLMTGLVKEPMYLMAGGSYPGTVALLLVYPEAEIAIAYVSNTWGRDGGLSFGKDGAMAKFAVAMDEVVSLNSN